MLVQHQWKMGLRTKCLDASEPINLHHFDLKIPARTKRGVVERLATVRFTKPQVLVHPDSLSVTKKINTTHHKTVCNHVLWIREYQPNNDF